MTGIKEYLVEIERDDDEFGRYYVTYDAASPYEAQANAMEEIEPHELIVAVYERVL